MENVGLFYGSTTGNTEEIAQKVSEKINAKLLNINDAKKEDLLVNGPQNLMTMMKVAQF